MNRSTVIKHERTLDDLYDKHAAMLYGVILQQIDNEEIAVKILQKAFINIQDNIDTYDNARCPMFLWMLRHTAQAMKEETGERLQIQRLVLEPLMIL